MRCGMAAGPTVFRPRVTRALPLISPKGLLLLPSVHGIHVRYGAPVLLVRKAADGLCSLHVLQKEPGVDRIGGMLSRSSFLIKLHTNILLGHISTDSGE